METKLFNAKIPSDLLKKFKIHCINNETQMQTVIIELIENYIQSEGVTNERL